MADHHETAKQALKRNIKDYLRPSSYNLTTRLESVNDLTKLDYDLFILDRDCTLTGYHSKERAKEFEHTLQAIGPRAELVSNSSYDEFRRIGEIFSDVMPVSKLVNLRGQEGNHLLRIENGVFSVFQLDQGEVSEVTDQLYVNDRFIGEIAYNFKKPDPRIIRAVVNTNVASLRVPENPRVLMVGDRYLTDIVCGNLAGVDTARVTPYKPFTDALDLIAIRYLLDSPIGNVMSSYMALKKAFRPEKADNLKHS
jgi:predicted HAD superfamily phosphohydrolase YqeG